MQPINNFSGRRVILLLILVMVVCEFIRGSTGFYAVVEGQSMYPTFRHSDVVQTRSPELGLKRGDVVILADGQGERMIKRIIGLPGESITLSLGHVYVNGQRLSEPYLARHTYTFKSDTADERPIVWNLDDQHYFVLGDNRLASLDSRNFGPVDRHGIRRVVVQPANAFRPAFCDVVLSKTGKPVRKSQQQPDHSL
ncbi:MAG: signal peptidase I [Verrucomicrobia bacterium]|nr:signal peptidase I [Verrucomicrobiota bacterium]